MELWTNRLAGLDRPEYYITDRDEQPPAQPKYHRELADWNARPNCIGICTGKRELENYLHPDAIKVIEPSFPDVIADFDDVPLMLAEALHRANPTAPPWDSVDPKKKKEKASKGKRHLNTEAADIMTVTMLSVSDPAHEIEGWLRSIAAYL